MNDFERNLLGQQRIPFNDAADFFTGLKRFEHSGEKTASMSDPPDETGELEGPFAVSKEQFAALIQNCIDKAMVLMQASLVYGASLRGAEAVRYRGCFSDYEYRHVIEDMARRASSLAGAVHIGDVPPPPATTDPSAAVKAMIRGEQELIQCLNTLKAACGDNPFKFSVERAACQAQERMDGFWSTLDPTSPVPQGSEMVPLQGPEALEEHEQVETPEQEAVETPEMQAAEQEAGVEEEPEKTAGKVIDMPQGRARLVAKMKSGLKNTKATGKAALPALAAGALGGALLGSAGQRMVDDSVARSSARNAKTAARLGELAGIAGAVAGTGAYHGAGRERPVAGAVGQGLGAAGGALSGAVAGNALAEALPSRLEIPATLLAAAGGGYLGAKGLGRVAGGKHQDKTAAPMLLTPQELQQIQSFTSRSQELVPEIQEGVADYRDAKKKRNVSAGGGALGGGVAGLGAKALLGRSKRSANPAVRAAGYAAPVLGGIAGGMGIPQALGYPQDMSESKAEVRKDVGEMRTITDRARDIKENSDARIQMLRQLQASRMQNKVASIRAALRKVANPLEGMGSEDGSMSSPSNQQLEPTNYLQAEMQGRQAQEANESAYYRDQAQAATSAAAAMQEQVANAMQQLEQLQQQANEAGSQIQQTNQQALAAQDEALRQTQAAANMRMGMQKLRAMMLEVASQDPSEMAAQELAAPAGGAPDAQMGEEVPTEAAVPAPGTAPPNGGATEGSGIAQQNAGGAGGSGGPPAETAGGIKAAHIKKANALLEIAKRRLPGALLGGGLGAAHHASLQGATERLQGNVEELESRPSSFAQALRLGAAKAKAGLAEAANEHPGQSLAYHAGTGALAGAAAGPAIMNNIKSIAQ